MGFKYNPLTGQFDITSSSSGGGGGTVTSVGISSSSPDITITNSPVTGSGTIDIELTTGDLTDTGTDGIVITNGTGAVVGTGTQIAQTKADATHNGYLASVDFNTFSGKAPIVIPTTNQMVYVNSLSGNDVSGDGSYQNPYATVAHAMTTITDASSNKPYVVALQAARQIETTDIFMKPYTFIVGQMQRATYIRINGGGALRPDPSHATANSWCGLANLYFGGGTPINWDLQALGGANCDFVVQDCTIGASFTYKGRNAGGGDYLEIYNGIAFGPFTMDSVLCQFQAIEFVNGITLTNTQGTTFLGSTFESVVFDSNASIGGPTNAINMYNCSYAAGVILTTTDTFTLNSYRGLPAKANRSFSVGTTVIDIDDATATPYNPAIPGNWSSVPTDVSGALDELAARPAGTALTVQLITLNSTNITNGFVTLSGTPTSPASTILLVTTAPNQFYGSDFTIVSGSLLSWNGLGLAGILSSGDTLTVSYF